jgi:hypothetical protein
MTGKGGHYIVDTDLQMAQPAYTKKLGMALEDDRTLVLLDLDNVVSTFPRHGP